MSARLSPLWTGILAAGLLPAAGAPAVQNKPSAIEPPAAGRPADFSQVVGSYALAASATPTEVQVEDPLVLTVRISGSGPAEYWPERRHLRLFPAALARDFWIKPLAEKDRQDAAGTWTFAFELRPRHMGVSKIPALRLVYYDPRYKRYQTSYAPSIALKVSPRKTAEPVEPSPKGLPPRSIYHLVTGKQVLQNEDGAAPGPLFLALLLGLPPACCALWLAWRRGYGAKTPRRGTGDGISRFIKTLEGAAAEAPAALGLQVQAYLQKRLGLAGATLSARRIRRRLSDLTVSADLTRHVLDLAEHCQALRFGPPGSTYADSIAEQAAAVLVDLESELCSAGRP